MNRLFWVAGFRSPNRDCPDEIGTVGKYESDLKEVFPKNSLVKGGGGEVKIRTSKQSIRHRVVSKKKKMAHSTVRAQLVLPHDHRSSQN